VHFTFAKDVRTKEESALAIGRAIAKGMSALAMYWARAHSQKQ
jgi:hypothetical protein